MKFNEKLKTPLIGIKSELMKTTAKEVFNKHFLLEPLLIKPIEIKYYFTKTGVCRVQKYFNHKMEVHVQIDAVKTGVMKLKKYQNFKSVTKAETFLIEFKKTW